MNSSFAFGIEQTLASVHVVRFREQSKRFKKFHSNRKFEKKTLM